MELKDISDIPYFAYAPGIDAWLILLGIAIFCTLVFRLLSANRKLKRIRVIDKSLNDLRAMQRSLGQTSNFKDIIFASSMTVRRAVSHVEGQDISTCSENELKQKPQSQILNAIIEIEQNKYRPDLSLEGTGSLINNLIGALNSYKLERQVKASHK